MGHFRDQRVGPVQVDLREPGTESTDKIVPQVGHQHPRGTQHRGQSRDDHHRYLQLMGNHARVYGSGAASHHHREFPGVIASFDGNVLGSGSISKLTIS